MVSAAANDVPTGKVIFMYSGVLNMMYWIIAVSGIRSRL